MDEIKWRTFEYHFQAKNADWFWSLWIIAIGIAVTAHLFDNLLFGIFILLSAFCLSLFASRTPSLIDFALVKDGVLIGKKLIEYSSLSSFWIENNQKIIFQSKRKTSPYIIVPLDNRANSDKIRQYLLEHLKEKKHQESFLQIMFEKLGF